MWVWIKYSDGLYTLDPIPSKAEAMNARAKGCSVTYVNEAVWLAYRRHREDCAVWYELILKLDNEAGEATPKVR